MILTKRRGNGLTPAIETAVNAMFFRRNSPMKFFVNFAMPGIETAIAKHFEVLFRDMANQPFDEINNLSESQQMRADLKIDN